MLNSKLFIFCAILFSMKQLAESSHFRGMIMSWKPVGTLLDRIEISWRVSWRRNSGEGRNCDDAMVKNGYPKMGCCTATCREGCNIRFSLQAKCASFSVDENWSTGEDKVQLYVPPNSKGVVGFQSCCWIMVYPGNYPGWSVNVRYDMTPRADSGKINQSPTTTMAPVVTVRRGCYSNITIPADDLDDDIVRCRWGSVSNECGDLCGRFATFSIMHEGCTLEVLPSAPRALHGIAIVIEDFARSNPSVALSTIPLQFLLSIVDIPEPCNVKVEFAFSTPEIGQCESIAFGETHSFFVVAALTGSTQEMTSLSITASRISSATPPKVLTNRDGIKYWYSIVSYNPQDRGKTNLCFTAHFGSIPSEVRCMIFVIDGIVPELLDYHPKGSIPSGTVQWKLFFNSGMSAQPEPGFFIHFYESGNKVPVLDIEANSINVSVPAVPTEENNTVTVTTDFPFDPASEYYISLDKGFVKSFGGECAFLSGEYFDPAIGVVDPVQCEKGTVFNELKVDAPEGPCEPCPVGFFQPFIPSDICLRCPEGTYADTIGSPECTPCPPGTYRDVDGGNSSSDCFTCPSGTFQPQPGGIVCLDCPIGHKNNLLHTSCDECPRGTYQPHPRQSACLKCSPGTYAPNLRSTACFRCSRGYYQPNEASASCLQCQRGTFQPSLGQTKCDDCLPGTFAPFTRMSSCYKCNSGTYQPHSGGTTCINCPKGQYQPSRQQISCINCEQGKHNPDLGQSDCIICPPGTMQPDFGQESCRPCIPGTYQPHSQSVVCLNCSIGMYQDNSSSIECSPCNPGTYAPNEGNPSCLLCEPGSVQSNFNSTSCESCLPGFHSEKYGGLSCSPCAPGSYQPGYRSAECLLCPIGTITETHGLTGCKNCCIGYTTFKPGSAFCSFDVRFKKCGSCFYDPETAVCCMGELFHSRGGVIRCCDGVAYNSTREICCANTLSKLREGKTVCCDEKAFNPHYEFCSRGKIKRKKETHDRRDL